MKSSKFGLCLECLACLCVSGIQATLSENMAKQMYSGVIDPENMHTYVYLYNVKYDVRNNKYCVLKGGCSCDSCNAMEDGLGVGILTTGGELQDLDQETTKNILWSGSSSFMRSKRNIECCGASVYKIEPKYSFEYVFKNSCPPHDENDNFVGSPNENIITVFYGKEDDKFFWDDGGLLDLQDSEAFLKFNGTPIDQKIDFFCEPIRSDEYPPLCIVQTCREALYRWEIEPSTITDILTKIGTIKDENDELPKETFKEYNCTYTANLVLQALGIIPPYKQKRSLENLALHAAAHIGIGLTAGMTTQHFIGPVTGIVSGVLTGAVTGIIDWWINREMTSPKQLVNWILDYQKKLAKASANQENEVEKSRHQKIAKSFRIIAHIPQPSAQTKEEASRDMFNYKLGTNFEYKTVDEALQASVKTTGKEGKFWSTDFELA